MKVLYVPLAACVLLCGQAFAEQSIDKTLPAEAKGEVEISNVAGMVSVSGWDRNEVHVSGSLGHGVERLDFQSDRGRTLVKVVLRSGSHRSNSGESELIVRVPKASRVNVTTVSAEISSNEVTGPQRLQSVSGDISSWLTEQDADVKTVSGGVSLRGNGKPGVLTLTTVSGDANVTRIAGEVTASTVSGQLELRLDDVTRARLRTTSGDLDLSGKLKGDARIDAETISGQLTLELKGGDVQVDVESFSGSIESCGGHEVERTQKYGPGSELRFTEGKGTARVRLESLSGDINVCTR